MTWIASIDANGNPIARPISVGQGVTPERAAAAHHLTPGTWREITDEEAAELQAPTPEELAAARIAAIKAQLSALRGMLPEDYTLINAYCGDEDADAIVRAKRAAHEEAAAPLRVELRALEGTGG